MTETLKVRLPLTEKFNGNGSTNTFTLQYISHEIIEVKVELLEAADYTIDRK